MARRALTFDVNSQLTRDMSTDDLNVLAEEEQELREQNQILDEMSPELRKKFDQIRDLVESEVPRGAQEPLFARGALSNHL